ncbi:metal ABC transporter ATP-binding protein [bacterium]|nr:metal ABC transporter ATP-binding protein [bacterium]
MKENIILKVKNLSVELQGEKILQNLSFEVREGEVLTILGPNGAGKTVLLKTLLGIFPYKGEIIWRKGVKIGYVPQRLPFIKNVPMTIEDFFRLKDIPEKDIRNILKEIGLVESSKKEIGKLSSGQFQRTLIGWALAKNPQVLLFDEPVTGIDIKGERTVYSLLDKLRKERNLTILLVTHDLSVIYKFSDFVICLNKVSVCQGKPKEILTPQSLQKLYGQEVKFYQHIH